MFEDPAASKPKNWDDREYIDDVNDKKPDDWDKPEHIKDPDAKKPEDWDEDMDGEWEPPMINNPEYKGEWKPKQIKNPKYQVRIRLSEERDFTFQNILAPVEKIAKTENGRGFIHSPSNVCSVFLFVSYLLVATSMLHQAFISLWNLQTPIFILFILHLLEIAINVEKCA